MTLHSLLVLCAAIIFSVNAWQKGADNVDWDFGCDWEDSDIGNVRSSGEECGGICVREPDCTHFTWSPYEGGTCWLKHARPTYMSKPADPSFVCGYSEDKWEQIFNGG